VRQVLGLLPLPTLSRRCRVPRDLDSITHIAHEADASATGVRPQGVERIWRGVERLFRSGVHPAVQLCVLREGEVVVNRAIGHASGNGPGDPREAPKVPATAETPFNIFSASKAMTAMVVHLLDERGELHVNDRVCEYIPEYGAHGKDLITLNHVLSHRAGVPNIPSEALDLDNLEDESFIVDTMCAAEPRWRPGRLLGYHAISGGFILGEVVRRVAGKSIREVLAKEILEPLGFRWGNYGVAPADVDAVAQSYVTGPPLLPPVSNLVTRALGLTVQDAVVKSNDPRFLRSIVPAGNVITTAYELARFFELLRRGGELDGVRIFEPRTIRRATAEQSYLEVDFTLGLPLRYGMGFMLGAKRFSLYGPDTNNAFGHLGFTNVIGWADPDRGVSGGLMTSGKPVLYPELLFLWDLMRVIGAECPKLA
jgi:CubicO group peptidase (beta-lactamase class C family)